MTRGQCDAKPTSDRWLTSENQPTLGQYQIIRLIWSRVAGWKRAAVGSGTRDLVIATPLPCPSAEPYCCNTFNTWYDAIKIKLKHSVEQILTQGSANLGLGSWPVWANELWPASGGALFGVYLPTTRVYTLLLTFKKVDRKLYSAYACVWSVDGITRTVDFKCVDIVDF